MALKHSSRRFSANIWPGFVDAMTALLLILFFVLSIFMIVQFVLRDTISGQDRELSNLTLQLSELADTLGLERAKTAELSDDLSLARTSLLSAQEQVAAQIAQISLLTEQSAAQAAQIRSFESQIAGLLSDKENLEAANETLLSEKEATQLALANARDEIDAQAEEARLAAAKREALEALLASLEEEKSEQSALLEESEALRLAEAAAAQALQDKLANADAELTAMTLALEQQRREAEETLTLLAAAEAAKKQLELDAAPTTNRSKRLAALLAVANESLSKEEALNAESARKIALLNEQTEALRSQLSQLQSLLDDSAARDREAQVQIENLGQNLNAALARVASEERARAQAEAQARALLEAEANDLRQFRSEFFGRLRQVLGEREGVRIVGDRFVFSSEVLFGSGSAELGEGGKAQIANVAAIINDIRTEIPEGIDWVLRVDGHTDRTPISSSVFADNWALSQARALSVVRYLVDDLGFPADRLAATGFGEFQPIDPSNTPEAFAINRRIELKFTEK